MGNGNRPSPEFRRDAPRLALTSGRTRRENAEDMGVGLSMLNKWVTAHRDTDVVSDKELDLAREYERLRRENRILKEERDIPKTVPCWSSPVRGGNSRCYAADEWQLPMAYWWAGARLKTWHMGRCALESGDGAIATIPARKMTNLYGSRPSI